MLCSERVIVKLKLAQNLLGDKTSFIRPGQYTILAVATGKTNLMDHMVVVHLLVIVAQKLLRSKQSR